MKSIFKKEELEYIKEYYPTTDTKIIAKKLNKTTDQIKCRANALGVVKQPSISKYQADFIRENYALMSNPTIAKNTGLNTSQVLNFSRKEGLRKSVDVRRKFSTEDEEFILNNYSKMTNAMIAKKLGKTERQIRSKVGNADASIVQFDQEKHMPVINSRQKINQTSLDNNFFKKINTEEKAYWLGFLYADGYVYTRNNGNKRLELTLKYDDKSHIEKFKSIIGSPLEIKQKTIYNKQYDKTYYAAKFIVNGKVFTSHLEDKGCVQNKSLILEFPSDDIVPKELIRHFIRGYMDGDGCVHHNPARNTNSVSFVGTKDLLDGIQNDFHEKLGLTKTKIFSKGRAFQMTYNGFYNCMFIFQYLYNDSSIFLDRKYEIFNVMANKNIA